MKTTQLKCLPCSNVSEVNSISEAHTQLLLFSMHSESQDDPHIWTIQYFTSAFTNSSVQSNTLCQHACRTRGFHHAMIWFCCCMFMHAQNGIYGQWSVVGNQMCWIKSSCFIPEGPWDYDRLINQQDLHPQLTMCSLVFEVSCYLCLSGHFFWVTMSKQNRLSRTGSKMLWKKRVEWMMTRE